MFSLAVVLFLLSFYAKAATISSRGIASTASKKPAVYNYTTVSGFFLQDDPATDPSTFDYSTVNFGLINRSYPTDILDPFKLLTQWQKFNLFLTALNTKHLISGWITGENVRYKLFFMARHGEGYHNVAESYYGTPAWDDYWSKLDGNGTITWMDADLTENGIAQATKANTFWKKEVKEQKISLPTAYYSSPLRRCLNTAQLTWSGLPGSNKILREAIGVHTCDERHNQTWIHEGWPAYKFEQGFSFQDPYWTPDVRETDAELSVRVKTLMDEVVEETWNTAQIVAYSSHSGALRETLGVVGHRTFSLVTGAVIPVLVKVVKL
ncbi:phosphoglycerate mutase-like protein [Atractiella rhizophila]|nr:phosphoglycerate mutase-like protein [Atractiella rhizophila]